MRRVWRRQAQNGRDRRGYPGAAGVERDRKLRSSSVRRGFCKERSHVNAPESKFASLTGRPAAASATAIVAEIEALGERLRQVRERIGRVIFGQTQVVDHSL